MDNTYRVTVEQSGLVHLPEAALAVLGAQAIIVPGKDNGIALYRPEEWERLVTLILMQPGNNERWLRATMARAVEAELSEGTVQLSTMMREYACIDKEAELTVEEHCVILSAAEE